MSSGKAQVNDDLEPGELPSYESLLVPARDGEGILSRAYIVAPESCLFVSLSPFCIAGRGFLFSMIHAMHQEDASRCLCQIYQCFLNMLFSD